MPPKRRQEEEKPNRAGRAVIISKKQKIGNGLEIIVDERKSCELIAEMGDGMAIRLRLILPTSKENSRENSEHSLPKIVGFIVKIFSIVLLIFVF